jgi:hypothetical protein
VTERRSGRRRRLPFIRSAVVEIKGRTHVVAVADLGTDGAFLCTRSPFRPGEEAVLKLVPPGLGREVSIPCCVVYRNERFDAATGRPSGIAVRFGKLDPEVSRRIEEFSREGFYPGSEAAPAQRYEYQVLERAEIAADELNRLGRDGWMLSGVVARAKGVQLVLMRLL